ncbi:MAG: murein biosynthesis integral membrane protein MurJ [Deltaproteobacteria bacterium]
MGRAAAVMMASVFLSRLLGYARDAVIAFQHGATPETDAYFAAFTIPDFLNYLLAGGALSITFIPIFSRYLAEGREEDGYRSFSSIATVMGLAMLFFILLAELLAERLVPFIAPGFPPDQVAVAARLTRIVLPAQAFFYLGGLLMAVQYSRNRFFLPALAPLVYNAAIIAGGLAAGRAHGMDGFAWGVLAGSFLGNFAIQAAGARRAGLSFSPRFDLKDPGLREFVRLSIPIMLGFSLVVVDEWMIRVFGSFLIAGAITWLNNARRLMQVPIGVFGQASGVASYPFLSALAARGKRQELWDTLSITLRWVFLVSCAAASVFGILSRELVLVVYQRGAFRMGDTLQTASALAIFSIGIPFWCAQTIVARGFFAMKDTWTPTLVGTGAWLATVPAYYLLTQRMGVRGLALASTGGIVLYAGTLYGILMARTVRSRGVSELREYGKLILAGGGAAYAGTALLERLPGWLSWESLPGAAARLAAGGAGIVAAYYLCGRLLRSRTLRGIRRREDLLRPPRELLEEGPVPPAGVDEPPSTGA